MSNLNVTIGFEHLAIFVRPIRKRSPCVSPNPSRAYRPDCRTRCGSWVERRKNIGPTAVNNLKDPDEFTARYGGLRATRQGE